MPKKGYDNPNAGRKEMISDFNEFYQEAHASKANFTEEYKKLTKQMLDFAKNTKNAIDIGKKNSPEWLESRKKQVSFLKDMENLLETLETDIGVPGIEDKLKKEHVDQIWRRTTRLAQSSEQIRASFNQEMMNKWTELYGTLTGIVNRVNKKFEVKLEEKNNEQVQKAAYEVLDEKLNQDERHRDYSGTTNLMMLVSLPLPALPKDQKEMEAVQTLTQAQLKVKARANALAETICPLHAVDPETKTTKNLSLEDLTTLKGRYDELLESLEEYRKLVPNDDENQSRQLAEVTVAFDAERKQVESAIASINAHTEKNENLRTNARPFSIYEVQGRINPDFDNGYYKKAQSVTEASDAFRAKVVQWKQDAKTKEMLADHDRMMAAFRKLNNDTLPQLMKLDRGDKGYLPAMTHAELKDLRDDYQNAVMTIDQYVKMYGKNPRSKEQKNLIASLSAIYPGMVERFQMLDLLAGGEDVKDLKESVDILNEQAKSLAEQAPAKTEAETKRYEEEAVRIVTEQDRLKDVGYFQMLLNDGQLSPQMLFESSESQRSADIAAMRREVQTIPGALKNFNEIMARNRRMRACPDTPVLAGALAVDPEKPAITDDMQEGFKRHFDEMQKQALELAAKMTEYYEPDEDGKTKLLNRDEIHELSKLYANISFEANMASSYLPDNDPRKAALDALDEQCYQRRRTMKAAEEYIRRNAPEARAENGEEMEQTRAFTLYELQGGMNPEIDNNALEDVIAMKQQKVEFEAGLNKLSTKNLRKLDPIRAEYRAFENEVDNLYNKVIPDLLRMDPEKTRFGDPVTQEKLQNAMKEFEKATMAFVPLRVDFENRNKKDGVPPITDEERKMFQTAAKLNQRISEKWLAMNYLLDRTGKELGRDVERHNDRADELKTELQKYKELKNAKPEELDQKKKELKHDAKFYAWVEQLDDLYKNKKLQPAALFENDPSIGRSRVMAELHLTEQNIEDVQMRNFYLGSVKWDPSGKRDLGELKEFQTALAVRNQHGSHTVTQYATKGDNRAKDIIELTLKSMPETLKNQTFTAVIGEEDDKDHPGLKKPIYGQKKVDEAIRDYYNKKRYKPLQKENPGKFEKSLDSFLQKVPDHDLMLDIENDGLYDYERKGFANAFSKEALASSRELRSFIVEVNRNLYNAGINYETYDMLTDSRKPLNYNQGFAKVAAQQLNLDLAQQKAPDPKQVYIEDRVDKEGNKPAKNLLPQTELWEQTKFQFGDARPDQTYDVVIASTEKNFNEQVPGNKDKEFYTTTKNFRSSSFVGFLPTSVVQIPDFSNKTAEELAQAADDIEKFMYDQRKGENKKSDPYTAEVNDYDSYQKGEIMANLADLQAMDYILGKPARTVDQLRIGFKQDENGKVKVSNVLGAETDDVLFSDIKPNDPSLTNPDNMLVMTSDMAQKILDWSQGKFSDNDAHVKAALAKLPPESLKRFGERVNVLAAQIRNSMARKDEFFDLEEEPDKIPLVGLQTKPGVIRILDRRDFNKLKLDDLAIGRNSGDYRTRDTKPPVNIFDAAADLPKQSQRAMMDKYAAQFSGDSNNKEFGHRPQSRYGKSQYEKLVKETRFERRFLENERNRSLMKLKRMVGDVARMDQNRKSESIFHWDTGKYKDVLKAQEELDRALTLYGLDRTINTAEFERDLIRRQKEAWDYNKNQLPKDIEEVRKQNEQIQKERDKAIAFNQKEKDPSKHKPVPELKPLPKPKKIPQEKESDTIKLNDPKQLKEVKEKMLKLKKKLEIYLTARVNPSSEFGKMRYDAMLKMYQNVNDRLADYITYTGDTKDLPSVAKLTEIPSKDGQPVPEDKKKYKISYEPMMDPAEWELRIPEFVREDYIKAARRDILDKAGEKPEQQRRARLEADATERMLRDRYEYAKKYYDLKGRKQGVNVVEEFVGAAERDAYQAEAAKKINPAKLKPVILKDNKPRPVQPRVNPEQVKKQTRATYENLMKGGNDPQAFNFAALSEQNPVPQPQAQPVPPVQPVPQNQVPPQNPAPGQVPPVQPKPLSRKGGQNFLFGKNNNNIINNEIEPAPKKDDNIIELKDPNDMRIHDEQPLQDAGKGPKPEPKPEVKEDPKKEDPKQEDKKEEKVRDLDFDDLFKDVVPIDNKEPVKRQQPKTTGTNMNGPKPNPVMNNNK